MLVLAAAITFLGPGSRWSRHNGRPKRWSQRELAPPRADRRRVLPRARRAIEANVELAAEVPDPPGGGPDGWDRLRKPY